MMYTMSRDYDAVIVGGGPAGSTAAAILADLGRRVVVVERDRFPRYHIGESLLPFGYFTLERLGLIGQLKASAFTKKYSVQFVNTRGKASQPFYFTQHLKHEAAQTWQVKRADFDQLLIDNAAARGAEVRFETAARQLIIENDRVTGVVAQSREGQPQELRAPITIDASGRDTFAVNRLAWRVPDPYLKKIAIWTYYRNAILDPGMDAGATTVAYLPEKGWFWYIPLAPDLVSVGAVAERDYLYRDGTDLKAILDREIQANEWIRDHLAPAAQVDQYRVTGDYSYRSRHCAMDGLVLIGDAFAFLDPVFSSGVFLALRSGEMAADAVHAALEAGDVSAERFADYGEKLCVGIEAMRRLVYAFYDQSFSFGKLLRKYPQFQGDITDCLIGNLWSNFDPLFEAVAEFAQVPPPLSHGRARVAAT